MGQKCAKVETDHGPVDRANSGAAPPVVAIVPARNSGPDGQPPTEQNDISRRGPNKCQEDQPELQPPAEQNDISRRGPSKCQVAQPDELDVGVGTGIYLIISHENDGTLVQQYAYGLPTVDQSQGEVVLQIKPPLNVMIKNSKFERQGGKRILKANIKLACKTPEGRRKTCETALEFLRLMFFYSGYIYAYHALDDCEPRITIIVIRHERVTNAMLEVANGQKFVRHDPSTQINLLAGSDKAEDSEHKKGSERMSSEDMGDATSGNRSTQCVQDEAKHAARGTEQVGMSERYINGKIGINVNKSTDQADSKSGSVSENDASEPRVEPKDAKPKFAPDIRSTPKIVQPEDDKSIFPQYGDDLSVEALASAFEDVLVVRYLRPEVPFNSLSLKACAVVQMNISEAENSLSEGLVVDSLEGVRAAVDSMRGAFSSATDFIAPI